MIRSKKKKTIKKDPLCSCLKAFCLSVQELETLSFIWLPMWSLVSRGEQHLVWITAGTVGQSSPSEGVRLEQWPLFVLCPPTPVDSTLRLEKTPPPPPLSSHWVSPGFRGLNYEWADWTGWFLAVGTTNPFYLGQCQFQSPLSASGNAPGVVRLMS